jgi:hypothetical protein
MYVYHKFIYKDDVYKIRKNLSNLIKTQYYSCDKLLDLKKIPKVLKNKKEKYIILRDFQLIASPKNYLDDE